MGVILRGEVGVDKIDGRAGQEYEFRNKRIFYWGARIGLALGNLENENKGRRSACRDLWLF